MNAGDSVSVIGATMCAGHRGQVGIVKSDTTQPNHAGMPMRLVDVLPEHRSGLLGGEWWIEESELKVIDAPWVAHRLTPAPAE